MADNIESRLASIRSRISTATQEEARNELLRENALATKKRVLASLKEDFDVDSLEEAERLVKKLKKALEEEMTSVESGLDELGA
jgi:hypothetical protein